MAKARRAASGSSGLWSVPELSRFFGVVIRMYTERGSGHVPHFHAYYQGMAASFSLDPLELIVGELPIRQRRLVEAWAEIHAAELRDTWDRLQAGTVRKAIDPLR